jgi:hypothetical protein
MPLECRERNKDMSNIWQQSNASLNMKQGPTYDNKYLKFD